MGNGMLVVKRHVGERIIIRPPGGQPEIVIAVTAIDGNRACVGIRAERSVEIWREEIAPAVNEGAGK